MHKRLAALLLFAISCPLFGANVDVSLDTAGIFVPTPSPFIWDLSTGPLFVDLDFDRFDAVFLMPFDIYGVNSATLTLKLFDDSDNDAPEQLRVSLWQPGRGNLFLTRFDDDLGTGLGAIDESTEYTFSHTFSAAELAALYNEISCGCGTFAIRLNNRRDSDFYLSGVTMDMNVADTPEPASIALAACGILALGLVHRRWRHRNPLLSASHPPRKD
jgi:hypothetical protein